MSINTIETQYLDLLSKIKTQGSQKTTRNGKVYSIFGERLVHDFKEGFPLLTTKKMSLKNVFAELRWFLDGETDIRILWKNNCHIWDNDWYNWFRKQFGNSFTIEELYELAKKTYAPPHYYDMGKIYGYQWRLSGKNDQLANIINLLKNDPDNRRMLVNSWNISELNEMALPPCHFSWQVWTAELTEDEKEPLYSMPEYNDDDILKIPKRKISLQFNARSQDVPLGTPYNIASYAMLLMMLANEVNMIPDRLIASLGDCHIYENQMEGVEKQLLRRPTHLPQLKINNGINAQYTDLNLINYNPQETIKFPLS